MSSSLIRVLRNVYRIGPKRYWTQLNTIGDTKSGEFVGADSFGNKFYENKVEDEIHMRTRWVEYRKRYFDMSQVEPAWHFWLAYGVDVPPNKTAEEFLTKRAYPKPVHQETGTFTRNAYVPYSTTRPKVEPWKPAVRARA